MSVVSQVNASPTCPICASVMVKRSSARGPFYGCSNYPGCRGTRKGDADPSTFHTTSFEPIVRMPGSSEQEAVFEFMKDGTEHGVINAGPGTGKTWTMVQGVLRLQKYGLKIAGVAFNKHIATEMSGKLAASGCTNAQFSTCHSMGYSLIKREFRRVTLDDGKMRTIFEKLSPEPSFNKAEWRRTLNLAAKLAGFVKNYLIDYRAPGFAAEMERLADHHGLDFKSVSHGAYVRSANDRPLPNIYEAIDLVPRALDLCKRDASSVVDYDDMVWLPIILGLPFDSCDMLIGDEQQDSNAVQHEFMMRAGEGARIIVVGDPRQAIYGFRGAHTSSMEVLTVALKGTRRGVREFPLTITRRCPKLHVMMARRLYPDIVALEDAPLGEIMTVEAGEAHMQMRLGDLVLCRVNKELIGCAYKLIRRGVRPLVKGRDFGKGILSFIRTLKERADRDYPKPAPPAYTPVSEVKPIAWPNMTEMQRLMKALTSYHRDEMGALSLLGDKAEGRIEQLQDKCSCVSEMIAGASDYEDLHGRVTKLFGLDSDEDPKMSDVVTLGTVHRTKGLEAARVFVLAPELIPHPAAHKGWEVAQEKNLAWVALTRAKFDNAKGECGTLVFCGCVPPILEQEAA